VGEAKSTSVSESIPFAQYDIHRQLMYKLRIYGLNAIFGLKIQVSIGEGIITAVATGTAFYVKALPAQPALKMRRTLDVVDAEDVLLLETQRRLMAKSEVNRKKIEEILSAEMAQEIMTSFDSGLDDHSMSEPSSEEELDPNDMPEKSRMQQRAMVIEIDDEQDEDLVLFLDDVWNENFQLCNIDRLPTDAASQMDNSQMVTIVKQRMIDPSHHPNRQLANIFKSMYQDLAFQMSFLSPCTVTGVTYTVQIPKSNLVQIFMTAMTHGKVLEQPAESSLSGNTSFEEFEVLEQVTPTVTYAFPRLSSILGTRISQTITMPQYSNYSGTYQDPEESFSSSEDEPESEVDPESVRNRVSLPNLGSFRQSSNGNVAGFDPVEITPLANVPYSSQIQYLGRISLHFIKESNLMYDTLVGSSGMGEFSHVFLMEILAVVKAHVLCLGGNAVVSFSIDQIQLAESIKNQGYGMISVSGDVVRATYQQMRNMGQLSTNIFPTE
jgi:uncharacterized protein YbjQ (UPF0145 family)